MNTLYFLDTNILVHLVRNDATGQHLNQTYGLLLTEPRPLVSGVTEGELRSLAMEMGRAKVRTDAVLSLVLLADAD